MPKFPAYHQFREDMTSTIYNLGDSSVRDIETYFERKINE